MDKSLTAVGSFHGEGNETRHKEGPRGGWLVAELAEVVDVGYSQGVGRMRGGLELRRTVMWIGLVLS